MAGRPRSFDRDHAVAVARDAFWRDGFEATSISELTREIGINPPSLYAAFGDKQGLFDAATECYLGPFNAAVFQTLAAPTACEALAELLRVTARAQTEPGTPLGCLVLSEPRLHEQRAGLRTAIRDRIAQGRAAGDVAPGTDPEALASLIVTVVMGMSARARDGAGADELQAVAELTIAGLPGA